jgi:protein SCO1/2
MRSWICVWMALVIVALASATSCQPYEFKGARYGDSRIAPEIELTNVKGGAYRLSDRRGQLVLMYFGYTFCPDICPGTLAQARQMFDLLGEQAETVDFLFITVDPERDTAEVMAAYVSAFHPRIVGLTGTPEELARIFDAYGIVAERVPLPESAVGYAMNHTTRVFLVDRAGYLRLSYPFGTIAEDMVEDIRYLLE